MKNKENLNLDYSLKILAKSFFIVFIAMVISKILTYLYKIITARTFGTEIYGLFSLTLIVSGFFAAFFSLGLQGGLLRYISFYRGKNEKEKIRHILRFSLIFTFPIVIIAGVLLFILSESISMNIFHNSGLIIFLKWSAIFLPILLFGGIFHSIIRAYEKIGWFSFIGNILVTSVQVGLLVIFIFLGLKQNAIIFSYNLGILALLVSSFFVCKYKFPGIFSKPKIKKITKIKINRELLSYSWPIMFFGLVMSVFCWIDSLAIGYFKTASDVGIYNAAIPLASILWTIPTLFLLLFFPLITKEYSKRNFSLIKQLSKQIGKWIFIFNLPIAILMILFPGAVINILFGPDYISAANSLRMLSIGGFFYSIFIVSENLLSMKGKSKIVLINLIIACVTNVVLNIILVPRYGINGAAFSTMISYFIFGLLSLFTAKHYVSITPLKRKIIKIFFVALIPALILFFVRRFFEINTIILILLGLFFIISYFFLILITRCFDENDLMIIREIKRKIGINNLKKYFNKLKNEN